MTATARPDLEGLGSYKFGWADSDVAGAAARRGLSEDVVRDISAKKNEPEWMLKKRLKALELFYKKPMPNWGADLSGIDFENIKYFVRSTEKQAESWDDLPADIKNTYDKLGIPEAEKARLIAGVAAQYESEVVYHKIREDLEEQGVLFLDTDTGLREQEDMFREYFASVIPAGDNKFSALNTAVWSGGSFIYVPPGVQVEIPLQAYFRINTENMGQFERTLIICDEGSSVHYVEGCLPAGQLVATADGGYAPIESVRVGDHVYASDGRLHRVSAVQARDHRGELYTFVPVSPANAFTVTEEHPVLAVRGNGADVGALAAEWIPAKDLGDGDFLVYPKPQPAIAQTVLPKDMASLLGYYLACGDASDPIEGLRFSVPSSQFDAVNEIGLLIKRLYDAEASIGEDGTRTVVRTTSKAALHAMSTLTGAGENRQLASEVIAQDSEFLTTLTDTIARGLGGVALVTTSRVLALQLQSVFARLGEFTVVTTDPSGYVVRTLTSEEAAQVIETPESFLVPITHREVSDHEGLVFNLDVDEPDSYLASGFAVHNCTAPVYSSDSLHSAVVEIIVKKNAHCRYTTIQNWSNNVYNLVTKRTSVQAGGRMEWIDGNIGSKVTMKYPACFLLGEGASGETLSVAFAGEGQHQDAGAKMVHAAPRTSSTIVSKSVARGGGRTSYRGLVQVQPGAVDSKATVRCDALLVDAISRSDTYPYVDVREDDSSIGHEASVSKVGEDMLFYLQSRGISENEAMAMIVRGFVEPIARELPMEYALELNRLIELQMEGSVG
jgi:Fe-S cluster assembly protein SufB